ncbi:MAG: hypothetical protein HY903_11870 [Deltaproteobacteria bacterium]|nr:hypothetical protein [Deltaproteobacteria bacterium]
MATERTAWLTENTARERTLIQVWGTLVGAALYALVASSCGAELSRVPTRGAVQEHGEALTPTVMKALPTDGSAARPDVVVKVVFSVPMSDAAGDAFALYTRDGYVGGALAWDSSSTVLAFRPDQPLAPADYTLVVAAGAATESGAVLADAFRQRFTVAPGVSGK